MPFHTAVEKHPQAEVAEAAEAMGDADNLLDHQIDRLSRAVRGAGRVVSEDLVAPGSDRAREGVKLPSG